MQQISESDFNENKLNKAFNTPPPPKKCAFTLAEVLITLVIIGVIAAITIPTVINNTKKQEYVSRLKKTYSTLATVTNKIMNDEGVPKASVGGWATSRVAVFNMYKRHLSYTKECRNTDGCYGQGGFKYLQSTSVDVSWGNVNTPKLILADGTLLLFTNISSNCDASENNMKDTHDYCYMIGVDINGEKPPNEWGRDAFIFVGKENGLYPIGCESVCPDWYGQSCACRVLRENAMNY